MPASGPLEYPVGKSIQSSLAAASDRDPRAPAIRFLEETLSYGELETLSNGYAGTLAQRGIGLGDRVAMMASNRPEFFTALYGILKVGASVVMISPAWKATEIAHATDLTEPALLVCDGDTYERVGQSFTGQILHLDNDDPPAVDAVEVSQADWDNTEAVLVFSSGTTGLPKAVRHTHASLGAATAHWVSALGLSANDRFQIATPAFHILGLLNMFASVSAGSSVRLHPRFNLDELLRCIEADQITLEMAVAPIALAMANHPDLESFDLSSLRYIMWGATPVTESVAQRVTERTGVGFLAAYGASEVPVITSNPVDSPERWRLDSAGLPIHDLEMRIVDLDTGEALESGATGEIQLRSPSMMTGYLPVEANDEAFADGWYRTGDVGWLEPDGWLHITDRVKEMIKVKGFQVAPAEIEAVLHGHDEVTDCAVFGVADEAAGEAVVAAVQLGDGASVTVEELKALVADTLATYKRLADLWIVDTIPRLPSGKVLRRELKARYLGTSGPRGQIGA